MILPPTLSESYITNGDGSLKKSVEISAPSNNYYNKAQSAVVQGKLYLFGGRTDRTRVTFLCIKNLFSNFKIARLDSCSLVKLPYRLNIDVDETAAALSISDNSEGKTVSHFIMIKF